MKMIDSLKIRSFDGSDADYEAYTAVRNAALPRNTRTVEEMREEDKRRHADHFDARWLAEMEGTVVGCARLNHSLWRYHPHMYWMTLVVRPEYQEQGVGSALYAMVDAAMQSQKSEAVRIYISEDYTRSVRFALDRGFVEEMRDWESRLDVTAFDPTKWDEARRRTQEHGIIIRTMRELEDDPDRDQKLCELENETAMDVPSGEPPIPLPYEQYRKMVLESSNLIPDGFIVAVEEATGKYVGSSNLWRRQADDDLQTGLTAVRREYRRQGIALAMKLRAVDYARSRGTKIVRTENATTNHGMLAINEALGFVKLPAEITFVKRS